jgi:hypothetical protein
METTMAHLSTPKPACWQGLGLAKGIYDEHAETRQLAKEIEETHIFHSNEAEPPSLLELIAVSKYAAFVAYQIGAPDCRAVWGAWTGTVIIEGEISRMTKGWILGSEDPLEMKILQNYEKGIRETHLSWSESLVAEKFCKTKPRQVLWSQATYLTTEEWYAMDKIRREAEKDSMKNETN